MGTDLAFAETSRQLMRYALDQSAGIDEDQRCPMRFDPTHDFVKLGPDIVRHYRTQLLIGNFYGKIEVALVADIDNRAVRRPVGLHIFITVNVRGSRIKRDIRDKKFSGTISCSRQT
jgi:hypothetical protein